MICNLKFASLLAYYIYNVAVAPNCPWMLRDCSYLNVYIYIWPNLQICPKLKLLEVHQAGKGKPGSHVLKEIF